MRRNAFVLLVWLGLSALMACSVDTPLQSEEEPAEETSEEVQGEPASDWFLQPLRELGTGPEWGMACPTYSGTEHLVERAKDTVILLGELAGTDQSAEAAVSLVCDLVAAGIPVNLGFAIPDPYLQRLQSHTKVLLLRERIYDAAPILWDGDYPTFGTRANRRLIETILRLQYDGHDVKMFGMTPEISGRGEVVQYGQIPPPIYEELRRLNDKAEGEAIVFLTHSTHAREIWRDRYQQYVPGTFNRFVDQDLPNRRILSYQMVPEGGEALFWKPDDANIGGGYLLDDVPDGRPYYIPEPSVAKSFVALQPPNCGPTEKCALPGSDGVYITGQATLSEPGFPYDPSVE